MPNAQDHINAAKKRPSDRSVADQALVDGGRGRQDVRNTAFEAERLERIYGRKKS